MKRKRSDRKKETLNGLARCVQQFYPELVDVFVCPTCLTKIPVQDPSLISDAHILPRVAGGGLVTFLCRPCNSGYGSIQDKWFGEYLRLVKAPGLPFLHARHQEGHFEIAGRRVNGRYQIGADGAIEFVAWTDKNSPETLGVMLQSTAGARQLGGSLEITIAIPILAHKDEITCGFITAAYLLWFRELGYSWAFQNHLDLVREQIAKPHDRILPKSAVGSCPELFFERPWIGTGRLAGELVLVSGIGDRLVLFPPVDRPDFYASLPTAPSGLKVEGLGALGFGWQREPFPGPVGLVFGDRLVVAPDVLVRGEASGPMIIVPADGTEPQVLYPVSDEQWDREVEQPNARRLHVEPNLRLPTKDTGR